MTTDAKDVNLLVFLRRKLGLTRQELAVLVHWDTVKRALQGILKLETGAATPAESSAWRVLARTFDAMGQNMRKLEQDLTAWTVKQRGGTARQLGGWSERLPDLTPECIPGFCLCGLGNPKTNFITATVGYTGPHDAEHFGAGRLMLKFTTRSGDLLAGVDGRPPVPVDSIEIWTGGDVEAENVREVLHCGVVALRAWTGGDNRLAALATD